MIEFAEIVFDKPSTGHSFTYVGEIVTRDQPFVISFQIYMLRVLGIINVHTDDICH